MSHFLSNYFLHCELCIQQEIKISARIRDRSGYPFRV